MRWIVLLFPLLLFGVGEAKKSEYFKVLQERHNPYLFDKKDRLELEKAKLEAQTKKDLAKLEYEKTIQSQRIKKEIELVKSQHALEQKRLEVVPKKLKVAAKERLYLYFFLLGIFLLIIVYLIFKRYQAYKQSIELEKIRVQQEIHERELAMKERELQAQVAGKLIDALASGKLTKEQEEKLLGLVDQKYLLERK